jgi:hypothetical protein
MEQLELWDLDELTRVPSNYELPRPSPIPLPRPPPIPPPRQNQRQILRNSSFDYYKFLCDPTRCEKDPVYDATPMFTTIPQSKHVKYHHHLLGCHFPANIVTPISTESPKSPEPSSADTDKDKEEQEQEKEKEGEEEDDDDDDEDDDKSSDDDDDDDDDRKESSSSSSSEDNDDNIFDNDDKKGVVQQLFDRHKKK